MKLLQCMDAVGYKVQFYLTNVSKPGWKWTYNTLRRDEPGAVSDIVNQKGVGSSLL